MSTRDDGARSRDATSSPVGVRKPPPGARAAGGSPGSRQKAVAARGAGRRTASSRQPAPKPGGAAHMPAKSGGGGRRVSEEGAGGRARQSGAGGRPPAKTVVARERTGKTSGTGTKAITSRAAVREIAAPAPKPTVVSGPEPPATLAIDIGGTGFKASVLDGRGRLLAARVRVTATYPCPPELMVEELAKLVKPLPPAERGSAGFPGVVRKGHVLTAPHFVTKSGPGSAVVDELLVQWKGFDLAGALTERLGIPVRVANDADLQGWAVVSGIGLEMVITLGTGVGSALFLDGKLAPHLELAHHRFRKNQTYNEQIGEAALKKAGLHKWRKRVRKAISNFESLVNYDRLYVGGGNGHRMAGHCDPSITIVDNVAGIIGGIKLWDVGSHGDVAG